MRNAKLCHQNRLAFDASHFAFSLVVSSTSANVSITKHMRVLDIITLCPDAEAVMAEYGLHCFHCNANAFESLVDGCRSHGIEDDVIEALVEDLNDVLSEQPQRPQTLTITTTAAQAIREIAEKENRLGEALMIIADGKGGFCLEFRAEKNEEDAVFRNSEVPDMEFCASPLTLSRIGGSTIDFRDGRLKLDLAEEKAKETCGCNNGGRCGC